MIRRMNSQPTVAIDFRWFDHAPFSGQYRYAVDLILGLAALSSRMNFVVLGSKSDPVAELNDVLKRPEWAYQAMPPLGTPRSLIREQWQYSRILRKLNVHLYHGLHTFVPILTRIPVVITLYDLMMEIFPEYAGIARSREYRHFKWAFRNFAARGICISQTTKDDIVKRWNYPADKLDVVYLGPELPVRAATPSANEELSVLSPYNLEPRKNLSTLLRALAKLRSTGTDAKLVLYGAAAINAERESRFREEVRQLGLENRIRLTGFLNDEQLAHEYRNASIFVFPSLYEGFGLPVLEAMQQGSCVLAHYASAMAEILGPAGLQVDMNSSEVLADAISKSLREPSLRQSLGISARTRASQFSRDRMARETLAVYEKVLRR